MPDLDRFELFVRAATTGSITQTAIDLTQTKAAVSKQIKKLKAELILEPSPKN